MTDIPVPNGSRRVGGVAPFHSCIGCLKGDVATSIAIQGESEWHIAILGQLMPMDEANATFLYMARTELGCDEGTVPGDSDLTLFYRVCAECGAKVNCQPKRADPGAEIPMLIQPEELKQ